MRVDLGEGRWAELHDRITHRIVLDLEGAAFRGKHGIANGEYPEDFTSSVILAMTREWSLGELNRTAVEAADADLVDKLYLACNDAYVRGRAEEVIPQA